MIKDALASLPSFGCAFDSATLSANDIRHKISQALNAI
jgi:hypothetical protein